MRSLELLAPARNKEIGIAAIDCGADAVYIGAPNFGARKDAGNSIEDIGELCEYAHQFGVKVFVTFNTLFREDETDNLHEQMIACQELGVDAFIIRDPLICSWPDIHTPLHASTQCAIRSVQRARELEKLGCERIVLERELSLADIRKIAKGVDCELEFFVHGALCVCYSGDCRLSEYIDGRSADRGECIQACRSLYDLIDENGRVLLKNKALLSLKDYNLRNRVADLAKAGICSFKIEGRLKNISYVRNVVRDYDLALNALVAKYPTEYRRASFGRVVGGFSPDTTKTFNRGYTELFIDGKRGSWASMDAPKSMGELVGTVTKVRAGQISIRPASKSVVLRNGDGFAFVSKSGVVGFRSDVCEGVNIRCRDVEGLREGMPLYRNLDTAFEKLLDSRLCHREIGVALSVEISGDYVITIRSRSKDGREFVSSFNADVDTAENTQRAKDMIVEQLGKRSGVFAFMVEDLAIKTRGAALPLLSASTINSMRRLVAEDLSSVKASESVSAKFGVDSESRADTLGSEAVLTAAVGSELDSTPPSEGGIGDSESGAKCGGDDRSGALVCSVSGSDSDIAVEDKSLNIKRIELAPLAKGSELMKTKYCLRYELGICPKFANATAPKLQQRYEGGKLFLLNNGRSFALNFDCAACEMSVIAV